MAVLNGYIPQLYRRRVRFIEKYIMEALEIEALKTDPNAAKDVNRGNSVGLLSQTLLSFVIGDVIRQIKNAATTSGK